MDINTLVVPIGTMLVLIGAVISATRKLSKQDSAMEKLGVSTNTKLDDMKGRLDRHRTNDQEYQKQIDERLQRIEDKANAQDGRIEAVTISITRIETMFSYIQEALKTLQSRTP